MKIFYNLKKFLLKSRDIKQRYLCLERSVSYDALKVAFFGTDEFSLPSLQALNGHFKSDGNISRLDVVTSYRAKKNPVRAFAGQQKLEVIDYKEFVDLQHAYDLGLVVSFGHMLSGKLIDSFPLGILNVHASLLPKLRGAAPIIHAIRNGDTQTGITIMKIRPRHFDVGEIICQQEVAIGPLELMPEIHNRLAGVGANLLLEVVRGLPASLGSAREQKEEEATYAPKIDDEFTRVRWSRMTSKEVFDLYRSLYSFKVPIATWHKEVVKLKELRRSESLPEKAQRSPGSVRYCKEQKALAVECSDGREVLVTALGIGKKTRISAQDFDNGFLRKMPLDQRRFS